ncbi:CDK5RAP3-like protein [Drosophila guanche]|uniref:Blast:CDK5RAP3-like protein n=1 Tax=Drosophila guanche TaxID=7266 RepID=A0A3B0J5C0_DROGU|nr:CDK5RAP3-like protein [Drosophila guanche]SPP74842.1 blast:CDK5RAP3-like protein [Drosophila guanche]
MNESEIPIDIHTLKLQDWLISRRIVPKNIQQEIKEIHSKISNALQDMPSNDQLIKLLANANINYYHVKEIIEILKQTEKDTKSVFGTYGSQRMKDWQEICRLYEKNATYLGETAQIFVRNVNFEIPGVRKQMTKLEQLTDESLKRAQDLHKPEGQLLSEHAALLEQLGVKGENLHAEFLEVLAGLPELYTKSLQDIGKVQYGIDLYAEISGHKQSLPILRHLVEFGNTTVYQYIHKEAPLAVEEPPISLNLSVGIAAKDDAVTEIDFGTDDNGGTSSTVSAEIIDYGDFGGGDLPESEGGNIDWGIESAPTDAVEINFDIPVEEYGIVVEGTGMDGGTAKGDQAYTLLDSPNYRDRFLDELFELESFLRLRLYELNQLESSSNIMYSLMDSIATHDADSIQKILGYIENIIQQTSDERTRHLFQLKHSSKYANLLATKLQQMTKAVEKIRTTREVLKQRAVDLREQRLHLNPVLEELIAQTRTLQSHIEKDISKRYKNRMVNLMGGVN